MTRRRRKKCRECHGRKPANKFEENRLVCIDCCRAKKQMDPHRRMGNMLATVKRRANRRKLEFNLDQHRTELTRRLRRGVCELSGLPLRLDGGLTYDSPSIDRIDSSRGYTYDNVRIIAHGINSALGNWGERGYWRMVTAMLSRGLERVMGVKR